MIQKTEGFVEREIKKDEIPVNDLLDGNLEAPAPREMIELESTFEKLENELKEVIASRDELKKTFLDLTQLKCILQKAQIFFHQVTERDRREGKKFDREIRKKERTEREREETIVRRMCSFVIPFFSLWFLSSL